MICHCKLAWVAVGRGGKRVGLRMEHTSHVHDQTVDDCRGARGEESQAGRGRNAEGHATNMPERVYVVAARTYLSGLEIQTEMFLLLKRGLKCAITSPLSSALLGLRELRWKEEQQELARLKRPLP